MSYQALSTKEQLRSELGSASTRSNKVSTVSRFKSKSDSFDILYFLVLTSSVAESPPPGSYRAQSEFEQTSQGNSKSKAYSFGISREAYEKVYMPQKKINQDRSIPGPGQYTLLSSLGKDARKISLQGRTQNCLGTHFLSLFFFLL